MTANSDEPLDLTLFACGTRCKHEWDGPEVEFYGGASTTCSKCGAVALELASMGFDDDDETQKQGGG